MARRRARAFLLVVILLTAGASWVRAQSQTVGLFLHDPRAADGYTLMSPRGTPISYLLNNDGLVVHTWSGIYPLGSMAYLTEAGHLVRAERLDVVPVNFTGGGGRGGVVRELDWDDNQLWEFFYSTEQHLTHHDIEVLPNGNVLMIAWEFKTNAEALQAGRDPSLILGNLWPDHVIEVRPTPPVGGEIVWEWHVWDHLIQDYSAAADNFGVVSEHPELIDINYAIFNGRTDWNHLNGIDYNAELDQIVVSVRRFNEFWVIDHSTTTEEAAGHSGGNSGQGGDLLYRWGNPEAYGRGTAEDRMLDGQHDAQWIRPGLPGEGNFLVYDNGSNTPGSLHSTVKEIAPPVDEQGNYAIDPGEPFGPADVAWIYPGVPDLNFYSDVVSGAQRQPNGNTLICEGIKGHLFEVTPDEEIVWDYVNPVRGEVIVTQGQPISNNRVFKVRRYPPGFPAFEGRDLTPGDPVEHFIAPWPVRRDSLLASRLDSEGYAVGVEWDADTCQSYDYKLFYGPLNDLPDFTTMNVVCDLGTAGYYIWSPVPQESLYFLVVGRDPSEIYESSWGRASDGTERHGTTSSFTCDATTKILSSQCP